MTRRTRKFVHNSNGFTQRSCKRVNHQNAKQSLTGSELRPTQRSRKRVIDQNVEESTTGSELCPTQLSRKRVIDQNVEESTIEDEPRLKKRKLDNTEDSTVIVSVNQRKLDLSDFRLKRLLDFNTSKKEIILEGEFLGYQSPAIVILEKKISKQWPLLEMEFFNNRIFTKQIFINDVYGDYNCFPKDDLNGWKMRIIHPATQMHLDKYTKSKEHNYLVNETYETYEKITRPYIESEALSVQWIDHILNGNAEQNQIIYSDVDADRGFVLLPDLKWDRSLEKLSLIIISKKKIKSLRDLNESHLPLLKNIRDLSISIMKSRYDLLPSQFKMSVHYQPTYYHFHVLISKLMSKNLGEHLLSTIINNIEMVPNYYQRAELSFFLKESHQLFKRYKDNGIIITSEVEAHED